MSTPPTVCAALRWATVSHSVQQLYLTPVPIGWFVNRKVVTWIALQAKGDKGYAKRRRLGPETAATSVSLAGTPHTSAILGSVVFDLTYFNEVTDTRNNS